MKLFVYGTLKHGFKYFEQYCSNAINIEEAATLGRIYHLKEGYPALEIPSEHKLAEGSFDIETDKKKQDNYKMESFLQVSDTGEWDIVKGQVMTFTNPKKEMALIDELEGFTRAGKPMYKRVLAPVEVKGKNLPIWLYIYNLEHYGERIRSGRWE